MFCFASRKVEHYKSVSMASWRFGIELVFSQGIILKDRTPVRDSGVVLHVKAKSWQGIYNLRAVREEVS